ncbi:ATP-binding cassette domain-containing protein [Priestia endophytica]|jgi:peptide/nickel transport system ATP-binding protein|uniref:Peptide/nickel transport system ATP-binding protein n=1 Tax=Priestia endophytica DSM 13796 TaxID=1121089 RepID=A0A1I6BZL2_9BACI|nr:ABC transporter ATP-binding protein [Priestia endophytica]KYG27760.1 dipeptide/oligopeptide/nickel ABC transporter ATP-binding protein [Priestia endophytica]MBG9813194.1 peptide ABC transporter ATPase [Priestia endophytica]SFQ86344.1 peptide/nickel transport system ATP-binding protein [Priestia endophytica DSM 13796]
MILSIEQVSISSREKKIVDNVSLSIRKGEWYALVGQSGSGKSLLSQSIGQLLHPNLQIEGKIFFKGENLLEFSPKQIQTIRGQKISYIFQDYQGSFTPFRTISQHFEEYQKAHGIHDPKTRQLNAKEELEAVGLDETLYNRYPFQLSGGQLQRVSIALALLLSPDLLIADEITTALDSVSGHKILELLAKRQKEKGCTILFITHDWRHVKRYATRLAVMKEGEFVESGNKHRILDHPRHEYTKQLIQAAPTLGRGLPSGLPEVENK